MAQCNSIKSNAHETLNMYPSLNATPSNKINLGQTKPMKLKIILLLRLKKEN